MKILALTHLWPKSEGDNRGVYIRQLYDRLAARHEIRVLVPRAPGLVTPPPQPGRPTVVPFSYLVPAAWSTFGYGGALTGDQRLTRTSLALAPLYGLAAASRVRTGRAAADLVHAHFLVPNGTLAAAGSGSTPLVISLHGSDVYLAERSAVMRRAARFALSRAAAIVPCSEDLGSRAVALGADPSRVHVIPYGADPALFSRAIDPSERARLRASLGAGDRKLVLFVGNLVPKKGVTHLIQAAKRLHETHPGILFVAVGDGPLGADLKAEALAAGLTSEDFRFAGAVRWAEIPAWYAAADVFTAPSVVDAAGNVDGLPNVVLEAMATALPVVASRVAGIPMAIRDGETGRLVPPGDPIALGDAIAATLADPARARALGAAARRHLETELTWERIAQRYEALLAPLVRAVPGGGRTLAAG
jgi:glycosyltransferase involved in cell wall biosynthesis